MTTHIIKLCVGVDSIEDLALLQADRLASAIKRGAPAELFHRTRMVPKRQDAVLDGGPLYWVIRGVIQARQRITAFEDGQKEDGTRCCLMMLDSDLIAVRPTPRWAFKAGATWMPMTRLMICSGARTTNWLVCQRKCVES